MSDASVRFFDLYERGLVTADEIDHFVEEWHESDSTEALAAHLGFTDAEYARWAEDARALPYILAERSGRNVAANDTAPLRFAARVPDDQTLSEMQEWLNKQRPR